jgi:hypothetical protein
MTALPHALRPWATQLALFPDEIAASLASMAARLVWVLGAGDGASAAEGAPDGYAGVDRRGAYERLLPSEWLLHDELPDEFMRRVVSGEHSFLARAYEQQEAVKRTVVLFDVGVEQLGAPRLVHIAALVVLAARAERRGSQLVWGALQQGREPLREQLHEGVTTASVRELLRARLLRRATAGDVERWAAALRGTPASEPWVIGAPELREHLTKSALGASFVAVSDLLESDGPARVVVRAHPAHPRRPARSVTLEVPPTRLAVQTLRDPFVAAPVPPRTSTAAIDPTSNIVFGADGRRLYVRGAGQALIAFHVPNSPRANIGPPAVFVPPPGQRVIAVGQLARGNHTMVVTSGPESVVVHVLSKRGVTATRAEEHDVPSGYSPPPVSPLRPLAVVDTTRLAYVDGDGKLVEIARASSPAREGSALARPALVVRGEHVVRSSASRSGLAYVEWHSSPKFGVAAARKERALAPCDVDVGGAGEGECRFFFAPGVPHNDPRAGLIVCVRGAGAWSISRGKRRAAIACPDDHTLVGCIEGTRAPGDSPLESLIVLDPTCTRLELRDIRHTETLTASTSPIVHAAASDNGYVVAFLTRAGELCIYSYLARAVVYRSAVPT